MKIAMMVLGMSVGYICADSAITRYASGSGFNTYRAYAALVPVPGGRWTAKLPGLILVNDFPPGAAFEAKMQAYDTQIGGKWAALNSQLVAAVQKDPLYAQTMAKLQEIDKKVAEEMKKQAKDPSMLRQAYEQKQKEYVEAYMKAVKALPELKTFLDAWHAYEKDCLATVKSQRKSGEKDKPVLDALRARGMKLQEPDTVFLIGQQLNLNVGSFDPDQVPAEVVKVIGVQNLPVAAKFTKYLLQSTTDQKCESLRQEAAKAYAQLDAVIQKNTDVTAKNAELQKVRTDLNAVQNQTTVGDKLLRRVLERELGMDFQLLAMNQIVNRAVNALKQQIEVLQKVIPADLKAAQKTFDAQATQALDAFDAEIAKIISQRRQAKIAK